MRIIMRGGDDPSAESVVVGVAPEHAPTPGSFLDVEGISYRIEAVYRWHEAFSYALGPRERAFELLIRRADDGGATSGQPARPQPPARSDGAAARPDEEQRGQLDGPL